MNGLAMFMLGVGLAYAIAAFSAVYWFANRPHRACGRCKKGA